MKRFVKTKEPLLGLPKGFTEVEYLESTGTQYIDTGVIAKSGLSTILSFEYTSITSTASMLDARSGNNRFYLCHSGAPSSTYYFYYGYGSAYQSSVVPASNTKYLIETNLSVGAQSMKVNGTQILTGTDSTNYNLNVNLYLFGMNYSTPQYLAKAKLYSCKILDDGTLIRDYIPAIDSSGRPCMYDLVEKKAYYNKATSGDEFIYGKQIIPVEYLESSGTQYIDTGYVPSNTTGQYAKMQYTAISNGVTFGGMISGNGVVGPYFATSTTNIGWWIRWGTNEPRVIASTPTTTNTYEMYLNFNNDRIARVDNIIIENSLGSISGNYPSLTLFRRNFSSGYAYLSGKIFSYKITEGTNLVRDMIPVIDENNVGYMFDKITHILYEYKGTDSFSYGKKVYIPKLRLVEERVRTKDLPNGFTEVEYLASTGSQYIDTGIKLSSNSKVDLMYMPVSNISTNGHVFGARDVASAGGGYGIGIISSRYIFDYNSRVTASNVSIGFTTKYRFVKDKASNKIYADGSEVFSQDNTAQTFSLNYNAYLFRINDAGSSSAASRYGRVYYCKIWDNGILIRDYIPCLDAFGVPCFFDKVEKKAYYNNGTGDFTYGREIIPVEYIENTGSSYIDTLYKPNSNTKVETKIKMKETTSAFKWLFLSRNQTVAGDGYGFGAGSGGVITSEYNNRQTETGKLISGTTYTIVKDKNVCRYNDKVLTNPTSTFTVNYNMPIFGLNDAGTMVSGVYPLAELYYFRIYDNNELIRDFIPAIDQNNNAYLFDKISHTYFENAGSGSFSYGEKVYKRRLRLTSEPWYTKKYDLLTYLEATGTQWINTDLKGNLNTKIEAKVYSQKASSSDSGYGIAGDFTTSTKAITMPFNFVGDALYSRFGDKAITSGIQQQDGTYTFAVDKNGYYVDGTKIANFNTTTSFTTGGTIMLFGFTGLGRNYLKGKMYYCKIWNDTTLVGYFRPAKRKSDNKYGMLDMVTRQFYTNAGTGDFTGE